MSKKSSEVSVAEIVSEKSTPPPLNVLVATATEWDGTEAQVIQGNGNMPVNAVACAVGSSNQVTIAQPETLCYEVLSVRLMTPVAQTNPANLIESGIDMNSSQRRANHASAKDQVAEESSNISWGNKIASKDYTAEELARTKANAKQSANDELNRIKIGNKSTIASAVEGEKTVIHVQVPENAAPGMLLSVEVPASKKGSDMQRISFPLPSGAKPGVIIEVIAGVQDSDEAAVLAKMERLRIEAEEKIKKETEQEEYSYKGLGDGEYEYKASSSSSTSNTEEEYSYGG
mmetsp:Transcript_29747/g.35089  ORF Transcript_29747/g.35089 Transcript_29747/m.35089 type:complete len:288 (-) Transcript_29747:206-1069(-)